MERPEWIDSWAETVERVIPDTGLDEQGLEKLSLWNARGIASHYALTLEARIEKAIAECDPEFAPTAVVVRILRGEE